MERAYVILLISYFTFNARELMKALLNRQPAMRLGAGPRDFYDIQVGKILIEQIYKIDQNFKDSDKLRKSIGIMG